MQMDHPWLKHYEAGVPPSIEAPEMTLQDLLPMAAEKYPERTALVLTLAAAGRLFSYPVSYRRLQRDVDRFAASLQGLGVQPGDRVALYLPNCPQFVIAYLAAIRAGAIVVPFNPLYSAREAEYQLKDCGAVVAVVLDRFFPLIDGVRRKTGLRHVVVTRIKEYFPPLLWTLYSLTKERKLAKFRLGADDLWFRDMLGEGTPRPVRVEREDTAVLLYTGGTTGVSKGVELSHRNLLVNCRAEPAVGRHPRRGGGGAGRGAPVPRLRPDLLPAPGAAHRGDHPAGAEPRRHGRPDPDHRAPAADDLPGGADLPHLDRRLSRHRAPRPALAARLPLRRLAAGAGRAAHVHRAHRRAPGGRLRADRGRAGDPRQPAVRRRPPRHHRPALSRHRGAGGRLRDRQAGHALRGGVDPPRRDHRPRPAGDEGLLAAPARRRRPSCATAGCTPATSASCTATATSASSTGSRT